MISSNSCYCGGCYYYLLLETFSHYHKLNVFYWSLSDSKSPLVSRTLLGILASLDNVIVWIVTTRTLISKSFNPIINPLLIVLIASISVAISITFNLRSFFQFPSKVLILLFAFFQFYSVVRWKSIVNNSARYLYYHNNNYHY